MAQEFALCLALMPARHALPPPTKDRRPSILFSSTSKSFSAHGVHHRNTLNSFLFMGLRTTFITTAGWRGSTTGHFKYHLNSTLLTSLECAVPRSGLLSPLECAVAKTRPRNSFRMRTSEKNGGRGYLFPIFDFRVSTRFSRPPLQGKHWVWLRQEASA